MQSKFEPFERDLKHSNANSNNSKRIQSICMQTLTTRKEFEGFESKSKANPNHSKGIRKIQSIQTQILTI